MRVVDGLITGWARALRLPPALLQAVAGSSSLLERSYERALAERYHWHCFGDLHPVLPQIAVVNDALKLPSWPPASGTAAAAPVRAGQRSRPCGSCGVRRQHVAGEHLARGGHRRPRALTATWTCMADAAPVSKRWPYRCARGAVGARATIPPGRTTSSRESFVAMAQLNLFWPCSRTQGPQADQAGSEEEVRGTRRRLPPPPAVRQRGHVATPRVAGTLMTWDAEPFDPSSHEIGSSDSGGTAEQPPSGGASRAVFVDDRGVRVKALTATGTVAAVCLVLYLVAVLAAPFGAPWVPNPVCPAWGPPSGEARSRRSRSTGGSSRDRAARWRDPGAGADEEASARRPAPRRSAKGGDHRAGCRCPASSRVGLVRHRRSAPSTEPDASPEAGPSPPAPLAPSDRADTAPAPEPTAAELGADSLPAASPPTREGPPGASGGAASETGDTRVGSALASAPTDPDDDTTENGEGSPSRIAPPTSTSTSTSPTSTSTSADPGSPSSLPAPSSGALARPSPDVEGSRAETSAAGPPLIARPLADRTPTPPRAHWALMALLLATFGVRLVCTGTPAVERVVVGIAQATETPPAGSTPPGRCWTLGRNAGGRCPPERTVVLTFEDGRTRGGPPRCWNCFAATTRLPPLRARHPGGRASGADPPCSTTATMSAPTCSATSKLSAVSDREADLQLSLAQISPRRQRRHPHRPVPSSVRSPPGTLRLADQLTEYRRIADKGYVIVLGRLGQ